MANRGHNRITTTNTISLSTVKGKKYIRIPVLRKATFNAGSYGPLDFDNDMFNYLQQNFEEGTIGHEVSIDRSHKPDEGALGWVRELRREGDNLVALAEPTPEGLRLVKNKKFLYASADIAIDWEDRETGDRFGPALMGIAFTNRPYVHHQEPISIVQLSNRDTAELRENEQAFHVFFSDDDLPLNARKSRNGGTMANRNRRVSRETITLASPAQKKASRAVKKIGQYSRQRAENIAVNTAANMLRGNKAVTGFGKRALPKAKKKSYAAQKALKGFAQSGGQRAYIAKKHPRKIDAITSGSPGRKKVMMSYNADTVELTADNVAETLLLWNDAARAESVRTRQMASRIAADLDVADPRFSMTPALVRSLIKHARAEDDDLVFPVFAISNRDQRRMEELGFTKDSDIGALVLEFEDFDEARKNAGKVGFKADWDEADHEGWDGFTAVLESLADEEDDEEDEDEDENTDLEEDGDDDEDDDGEEDDDDGDEDEDEDDDDETVALSNRYRRENLALQQQIKQRDRALQNFVSTNRTKQINDALRAGKERGVPAHILNFAQNALEATQQEMGDTILRLSEKSPGGRRTQRDLDAFGTILELVGMVPGKIPTRAKGDTGLLLSDDENSDSQINDRMRKAVRSLSVDMGYKRSSSVDDSDDDE